MRMVLTSLYDVFDDYKGKIGGPRGKADAAKSRIFMEKYLAEEEGACTSRLMKGKPLLGRNVKGLTELDKYLNEDSLQNADGLDLLKWWKNFSGQFPILSKIAKDVLALPITAVRLETCYCTDSNVLNGFRSSLSHSMVEALVSENISELYMMALNVKNSNMLIYTPMKEKKMWKHKMRIVLVSTYDVFDDYRNESQVRRRVWNGKAVVEGNVENMTELNIYLNEESEDDVDTVGFESGFSTNGNVLDNFRSSLSHSMVEALVCTRDWIRKSGKQNQSGSYNGNKDTLSSCSDSKEQAIQQLQMQAKILKQNSMNKFTALKTTTQRLERKTFTNCRLFQRAFSHLFHTDVKTFKYELSQNMNNLEKKLNNEILHKKDSKSALTRQDFKDYTQIEAQSFKDLIIQHMESIEQCIVERARHEQEIQNRLKRLNERKLQIQECKIQEVKALDVSLGDKNSSGIVSDKGNDQGLENQGNTSGDKSSRSRNECNDKSTSGDDTITPPNLQRSGISLWGATS
ncbi:zinc finger BED domain-containing protein RICESLEEPER 2-like protein [Tanacetum coccineum]